MLWVFHSEPFDFAWTVVAEGQLPLPDHSRMSISPPGSSLPSHQAGQARGAGVEFDPGLPGVADASAPVAGQPAAVEGGTVLRGADDKVGVAIQEYVLAIVPVLPDMLGQLPIRRIFHRLTGSRHVPLRAVGGRAGGAVELVLEYVGTLTRRGGRRRHRAGRVSARRGSGATAAMAASPPKPAAIIMVRRSISGISKRR